MSLLCRVKTILAPATTIGRSPFRTLTLVVSAGLLVGYGSVASATTSPAVPIIQEHEEEDHNVILHELNTNSDGEIKVVVVKGHLHKLHANSDGDHNVFVLKDDDEDDTKMNLHGHLAELLHGQESGKMNHQALARKLRQLADRLEAKHNEPHSAHQPHGKIEIHPSGEHKFHIEKRGDNEKANHQEFEFTTDAGKHIVIGKPGQTGTMVIELKPASGGKLHSHDGDQKRIILHGQEHDAGHNVVVDRIRLDGDHSPSELSQKILGRIKKHIPEHKVVIEAIHKDGDHSTHAHESHAFEGERSQEGLDVSIRDLRNELEELRRELKELQSDRPDRKND